jgi:hypothetical protein
MRRIECIVQSTMDATHTPFAYPFAYPYIAYEYPAELERGDS